MLMIRKIKLYFRRREFKKRCLNIACSRCPHYLFNGKCYLAISLGLEEVL